MAPRTDAPVRAILGPTNTGKTHLAIERMCGHSSGVIGFPLRLLAREVYDRVIAMKGEAQVALLTGEEQIVPPTARHEIERVKADEALHDVMENKGGLANVWEADALGVSQAA